MILAEYRPEACRLVRKIMDREKITVVFYFGGMKEAEYTPSTGLWKTNSYGDPDMNIVDKCTKIMKANPSIGISEYDVIVRGGNVTVSEITENG